MIIQSFVRDDLKHIPVLQPEGWPDITPSIDFYTKSSICFPLKLLVDDEIAGIGTAIIHHKVAWLAHIIVRPDFRRKGIGRSITEALVNRPEVKQCETIYLVATELGAPVYEKVGFQTETEYLYFKDVKINDDSITCAMIHPYESDLKGQLADLDKLSSTEDRLSQLEPHLENGYVYLPGKVEGFYLPGFGDGLIIANNPPAGLALVNLHLQSKEKIAFPKDNKVVTTYLYERGFREFSRGKRMRIGKKRNVRFENIYNRIGGNLG